MATRGFEVVSKYKNAGLEIPQRQTKHAAGYDFSAAEDFVLPSIWKQNFVKLFSFLKKGQPLTTDDYEHAEKVMKPLLVPTGIKAFMAPNEYLMLANRSSNSLKKGLVVPNGVGIIDADYYNNDNNEGEIFLQLVNMGIRDVTIKKGERIGQGIFMSYLVAEDEARIKQERSGGFGSTGRKQ